MTNVNKTVDVAALDLLCDKLECGDANHRATAAQIRKAMNGVPSWSSLKGVLSEDKRQLPEGIEWPRFEDGELVKMDHNFMNAIWDKNGPDSWVVTSIEFKSSGRAIIHAKNVFGEDSDKIELNRGERVKRPEPEVLDADGVPIKVGDTVWYVQPSAYTEGERTIAKIISGEVMFTNGYWAKPENLTHRNPDTLESVVAEMLAEWDENNEEFLDMDSYFARFRKLMGGE